MDTEQYVFVKCKIVGKGTMCYTLEDIIDLVVVGMENGEYNHKFSIFKDDSVPLDNLQFLSWFENRCKNDMSQEEWDVLKSNIQEYFV